MKKIYFIILIFLLVNVNVIYACNKESIEKEDVLLLSIYIKGGDSGIATYSLKNKEYKFLISGSEAEWNPKKDIIVYSEEEWDNDFVPDIYIITRYGNNKTRLTQNRKSFSPTISDKNIAFISDIDLDGTNLMRYQIFLMSTAGNKKERITMNKESAYSLDFSPNGKKIAYYLDGEIAVVDIKTKVTNVLTSSENEKLNPKWSPDGEKILYISKQDGSGQLEIIEMKSKQIRKLPIDKDITYANWSPDGKRLVFLVNNGYELYLLNEDGTGLQQIKLPIGKPYKIFSVDW